MLGRIAGGFDFGALAGILGNFAYFMSKLFRWYPKLLAASARSAARSLGMDTTSLDLIVLPLSYWTVVHLREKLWKVRREKLWKNKFLKRLIV